VIGGDVQKPLAWSAGFHVPESNLFQGILPREEKAKCTLRPSWSQKKNVDYKGGKSLVLADRAGKK